MSLNTPTMGGAVVADDDALRTLHALAGWPELDTVVGVRSLNGKIAKYLAMLGRLSALHGADGQAVRQAWRRRDRSEIRRLAHRLRGIAATLGATRVAATAGHLDHPTLDTLDDAVLDARVAALDEALTGLLHGLFERASIGPGAPAECLARCESSQAA